MLKKIKDFSEKPKQISQRSKKLDNLAVAIFGQNSDSRFVLSTHVPKPRYNIDVDESILEDILDLDYKDKYLPAFQNLGPNEKYVVHKIFYSTNNVVCVIGGIGVGKTSLSKYLEEDLLPDVIHQEAKDINKCPGVIYFDFNAYDDESFPKATDQIAIESFSKILSVLIGAKLAEGDYFSITSEVSEVWDALLLDKTPDKPSNPSINWLRDQLRIRELQKWDAEDKGNIIGERRKIREQLVESKDKVAYFAALLNYIKSKYYADHHPCLCLIIDNVDRELPRIHRIVEKTIITFSNLCDVKVVFNARQTTYHQGTFQKLVDLVPYCGPDPLEIVYSRINNFLNEGPIYERCLKIYGPKDALDKFGEKLLYIKKNFLEKEPFINFFKSLCGHSVRKGLKIAQNLIDNSVYDPLVIPTTTKNHQFSSSRSKQLRLGDIFRALMVRTNETFVYQGVIENIFQTEGSPNSSHFIKLRILKATRKAGDAGLKINRLENILKKFGYSDDLIEDSLDEMLSNNKRLIWTDTSSSESVKSKYLIEEEPDSILFISSIGEGYINFLCKKLDYIREVMLDTSVESNSIGTGHNYRHIEEGLTLLQRFCEYLTQQEELEMKEYNKNGKISDFERVFGDKNLISLEIMEAVAKDVQAILGFVIETSKGDFQEHIRIFEDSHSAMYYLKIDEARWTEKRLFGN